MARRSRARAQQFLVFLIWPVWGLVWELLTLRKHRVLWILVLFCGLAGWTLIPSPGSDADTFMNRILQAQAGVPVGSGEPLSVGVRNLVAALGFDPRFYLVYIGLAYGLTLSYAIKLFDTGVLAGRSLSVIGWAFVLAFFLNFPIFSGLNGRYHWGIWVLLLSTILIVVHRRWKVGLLLAWTGVLIHFGMAIFAGLLTLFVATRFLGPGQIVLAYGMLGVVLALPRDFFPSLAESALGFISWSEMEAKAAQELRRVETSEFGTARSGGGGPWFLRLRSRFAFWGLLISGHLLWWRIRLRPDTMEFKLWVLVIMMLAFQYSIQGGGIHGRMQTITMALLLLWHAVWFARSSKGWKISLLLTGAPLAFYFLVSYRRWLNAAGTGLVLPTPFNLAGDVWPAVSDFIFW